MGWDEIKFELDEMKWCIDVWVILEKMMLNRVWNYIKGYVMIVVGWNRFMDFLICIGVEMVGNNEMRWR